MTKKSTQRLKFSAERIRALPCSDGKTQYFYDIDCKGLDLSVGKSGQKSFLLYKKVRGKPRRIAIGPFPEVSVELARKKALKLAGEIATGLTDGVVSGTQRFSEAFADYMREYATAGKRSSAEDRDIYSATSPENVPYVYDEGIGALFPELDEYLSKLFGTEMQFWETSQQ